MRGAQLIPYPLPSITTAVSTNATTTLRDLPKTYMGRICHLAGISFEVSHAVTTGLTLSSGTATPLELQGLVTRLEIFDGNYNRFTGNFASLRFREALENYGRLLAPESDAVATTEAAAYTRMWWAGPNNFEGAPSDWAICCSNLENAEVRYGFGALTDIDANCTAAIATITPIAWLMLRDEVVIPPAYEFSTYTAGAQDINLTGRALYNTISLANSSAFDAITSLDFANVQVDVGTGSVVPNVHAAALSHAFWAHNGTGPITNIVGDQRASTVDGAKEINSGTPTALQVAAYRLSPVLWSPPDCRITKLTALAESVCRVRWSGANTTGAVLVGRILEQNEATIATLAAKAMGRLGLSHKGVKVKTLSKQPYVGPRPEFMPWSVKVRA